MTDDRDIILYEYCLLRFVPDVERGEQLNVGLLMMSKKKRWLKGLTMIDEQLALQLCGKADVGMLRNQLSIFERLDVPSADVPVEEKYRWMSAVKSTVIQTSPSHPGIILAEKGADGILLLEEQFKRLFQRLVVR